MLWVWQPGTLSDRLQNEGSKTAWRQSFKRTRVAPEGQGVTRSITSPQHCALCGRKGDQMKLRQSASCKKCFTVPRPARLNSGLFIKSTVCKHHVEQFRPRQKTAPLIGRKHSIDCYIQSKMTRALWDSGSQATIRDEKWREQNFSSET